MYTALLSLFVFLKKQRNSEWVAEEGGGAVFGGVPISIV